MPEASIFSSTDDLHSAFERAPLRAERTGRASAECAVHGSGGAPQATNFTKTGRVFDAYRPSIIISSEDIDLVGYRPPKAEELRMPGSNEHAQKSMHHGWSAPKRHRPTLNRGTTVNKAQIAMHSSKSRCPAPKDHGRA